jgi:hypothetical protein
MTDKFTFSSMGEAQMIEFALARNGYTHELVSALAAGDQLGSIREVLLGNAVIVPKQGFQNASIAQPQIASFLMPIEINADLNPHTPSGLYLADAGTEHRKMGKITLEKRADGRLYANGVEVVRYLSPNQKNGKSIRGVELRAELKDKKVLNACILDCLYANPHLIPDEWKTGYTYFWGTRFRDAWGSLYVKSIYCVADRWDWSCRWIGSKWHDECPAAVLAS